VPYRTPRDTREPPGRNPMSCDHLICARCAGPVVEERCPACRTARAELHGWHFQPGFNVILVTLILALVLAVTLHLSFQ
jgi:hypothetical protein